MNRNYSFMSADAAIHVFSIRDSDTFGGSATWRKRQAYYFTGLEYRMLICPAVFAEDESLIQRPGLYLKTNTPIAGLVYFPRLPDNANHKDFLDNLAWMADSYLFKYNASRPTSHSESAPRYYVDYANSLPIHGPHIFDDARVFATQEGKQAIDLLNLRYCTELTEFIASHPDQIGVPNYAETSLLEEVCSHSDFLAQSLIYAEALATDNPQLLSASKLTHGREQITCDKMYNRVVMSFYLAAIKEQFPNSPGSYIGMYKNLYNVLEYLMQGEGSEPLCEVLRERVGTERLRAVILEIKDTAHEQSCILSDLNHGERLSSNKFLPPISENDPCIAYRIAERLYTKRNAVIHSKKTFRGQPVDYNIAPGPDEGFQLNTDLAIIRPIAEIIVEELDVNE